MKVIHIEIEDLPNAGCNNGNYPEYTIVFDTGLRVQGITCRCGNGCSGTDRIPDLGQFFASIDALDSFLNT